MIIYLPLSVQVTKKKPFILNLNVYRNAHYQTLNKAKALFKEAIWNQLMDLPVMGRIKLTYTLYPGSAREVDVANVCSIQDKFFCDALVEAKKLPDDNYKFLPTTQFQFGEIDRKNPRVEVEIEEIDPMQVILNQADLDEAVQRYVRSQINISEDTEIAVTYAGQVTKELSATLSFGPAAAEPPKRRRRTKAQIEADEAVAAKAKEEAEAEEELPEEEETAEEEPEPVTSGGGSIFGGSVEDNEDSEEEETKEDSGATRPKSLFASAE